MIVALSHFGNFSGMEYMQSSSTDVTRTRRRLPSRNATDLQSRASTSLSSPSRSTDRADEHYDDPELTSAAGPVHPVRHLSRQHTAGGIPFIDIANAYVVNCGAQFSGTPPDSGR